MKYTQKIIVKKEWREDVQGEWKCSDWEIYDDIGLCVNDVERYWDIIEILDTDKHSHPTIAIAEREILIY